MSKFRYPKCPYCETEYTGWRMGDYTLYRLATNGDVTEATHLCDHCGKKYKITVKIMYYGVKMNET